MLQNRHIVITGIQSWNISIGSNIKNIAAELAKRNKVLFVNPPLDKATKLRAIFKSNKAKPIKLSDMQISKPKSNLWVFQPQCTMESINKIPFSSWFNSLNKRNSYKLGNEINNVIKAIGFTDVVHICDSDMFRSLYLKETIKPSISAYYSRDNLLAVDYWKRHGNKAEPAIMSKSDLVLTNSLYLEVLAKKHNPNSFFVGQGCDTTAYKPRKNFKTPKELKKIKFPIIGYIGSLNTLRLDIDIIEHISTHRPKWNIVLVGPEDDTFKKSNLHKLPNVIFTGSKPENGLAEYLNTFDVAINPQFVNEVTRGNYPRKVDEYLAMGKAVVATKTEAMEYFSKHVSLAVTPSDWVKLIEKELENNDISVQCKRIDFASKHTWANNVKEIGQRIVAREHELKSKQPVLEDAS